jgi:hypothetical protein
MDPGSPAATQPVATADADASAALAAKLELATQDRARLGETNKKLNDRLRELESKLNDTQKQLLTGKTQKLEEQGEYQRLWEEAKQTISQRDMEMQELQNQLQSVQSSAAQERLKAAALGKISQAGVIAPDQLYLLMAQNLREVDGQPVALNGGVEQPLGDYLAQLKNPGSGYEHFFSASGARGMGSASVNAASIAPGMRNPWRQESFSLTEQFALQDSNPDLAAALQAEAQRG